MILVGSVHVVFIGEMESLGGCDCDFGRAWVEGRYVRARRRIVGRQVGRWWMGEVLGSIVS